jgi:hypothetical protein
LQVNVEQLQPGRVRERIGVDPSGKIKGVFHGTSCRGMGRFAGISREFSFEGH